MARDDHDDHDDRDDDGGSMPDWTGDSVTTAAGVVIPVRATARRPEWAALPPGVRSHIEARCGARVVRAWSAGTGFTPGFASRLDLDDGRSCFVKAASSADDRRLGWSISGAYREEARKLAVLGADVAAPELVWSDDTELDGEQWVLLGMRHVEGRPPRRPWRLDELDLVLRRLAQVAPALAGGDHGLGLGSLLDELGGCQERLDQLAAPGTDGAWVDTVRGLCDEASAHLVGDSIVHLDLRDDNVLIDLTGGVWFVDWNWPMLGAPWFDLLCLLLSAHGDGLDTDRLLTEHALARGVDPHAFDVALAVLWSFWAVGRHEDVVLSSPHLRDHQAWYADVTEQWLRSRLARQGVAR